MKHIQKICLAFCFAAFVLSGCKKESVDTQIIPPAPYAPPATPYVPPAIPGDNDHMLMGNPNAAATIVDSSNNYLMRKMFYTLSYNNGRGGPNWVSWHLSTDDIGSTPRQDDFREDNTMPSSFYRVLSNAFSGTGFDRGHNCPSGDRTLTIESNSSTFLMNNMIPQAPVNNQQTWEGMETYTRNQLNGGKEAYVIMGSYGIGGSGSNGFYATVDNGHVTVPAFIWKVVVLLNTGNNDISRIDANTRVFAVIVPNNNSVNTNWKTYRTSVDNIEAATGYNLLSALPVAVQTVLEAQIDNL